MRIAFRLLILALALFLGGCGRELVQARYSPAPKVYKSIISLSPSTTEVLAQVDLENRLKGRTQACNYPNWVKNLPIVAGIKPEIETIVSLTPKVDLAVYDTALYNDRDLVKLKELGIELYPFKADSVDEFIGEIQKLAAKLGFETGMSEYIDKIVAAEAAAKGASPSRPTVALINGDYIAGKNSFYADVVRQAGGTPVGPDSIRFEKINPESLVAMNPQIILDVNQEAFDAFENGSKSPAEREKRGERVLTTIIRGDLLSDPRFQSLQAIKKRRIASLRPDVALRKGSRVNFLLNELGNYLGSVQQ